MIVLYLTALASLTCAPLRALPLPEAESTWTESGPPAHAAIDRMRQLRLTPLVPPTPDLASVRAELEGLRKKLDQARNPPPGIGIFFGEGDKAAAVSQILIGGPADKAGVRVGDVFVQINGQPVRDYMQIAAFVNAGPGPIDVTLRDKTDHVSLTKRPPEYLPKSYFDALESRFARFENELDALESAAAKSRPDLFVIGARRESLASGLRALTEELSQAMIKASTERYRSS